MVIPELFIFHMGKITKFAKIYKARNTGKFYYKKDDNFVKKY